MVASAIICLSKETIFFIYHKLENMAASAISKLKKTICPFLSLSAEILEK